MRDGGGVTNPTTQAQAIEAERHFERSELWRNRFMISLTVGNAAGLAGLASLISGENVPPALAIRLIPWMWAFAVGLSAAGVVPLCTWREARWYYAMVLARSGEGAPVGASPVERERLATKRKNAGWRWARMRRWATAVSAAFFVGLFGALGTLTANAGAFGQSSQAAENRALTLQGAPSDIRPVEPAREVDRLDSVVSGVPRRPQGRAQGADVQHPAAR